jgi:hypothetical protein
MIPHSRVSLQLPEKQTTLRALLELARIVAKHTREAIDSKSLMQIVQLFGRANITSLKYTPEGLIESWGATHEIIQKPLWQRTFGKPTRATIQSQKEFIRCLDLLRPQLPENRARGLSYWLETFVDKIESQVAQGCEEDALLDTIAIFISDLENAPCDMTVAARLTGITLPNDDPVRINGLSIRRLQKSDFEVEHPLRPVLRDIIPMSWRITPSAVLEFNMTGDSPNSPQIELFAILGCLCLFRLGAVRYIDYEYVMRSIIRPSNVVDSNRNFAPSYKYMLEQTDVDGLATLITKIKPCLPVLFDKLTKPTPSQIAFHRYTDGLLRGETIESRITSAITCLEALFLREKERSELTHKLGLRCAALMRALKKDPLEVKNCLSRAYDIRSTYVHGGLVDSSKSDRLDDLCMTILEYARLAVLISLQIHAFVKKDDFIADLDKSLLDPAAADKITRIIGEVIVT